MQSWTSAVTSRVIDEWDDRSAAQRVVSSLLSINEPGMQGVRMPIAKKIESSQLATTNNSSD